MTRRVVFAVSALFTVCCSFAHAIGERAHAEIGRMAVEEHLTREALVPGMAGLFEDEDNLRALYSGCAFPDWGYGGINPDAAEFTHWNHYMEAYVALLQRRFPPPWDAEARRQICFFLGVLCHNIADIPWHFDEEGHKSFLSAGYEADGAGHVDIEFACDYFLYAERALEPSVNLEAWFPIDLLTAVFAEAGRTVNREQLVQGTFRSRVMFFGGPLVAAFQRNGRKAKMPWVYDHYDDYYYGGLEHDAAATAVMARYMVARLGGDYFYQNTPLYSSYVRRNGDYVPRLQIEDATVSAGELAGSRSDSPFLEIGGEGVSRRYAFLRVDLGDIPRDTELDRARLYLHLADAPAPGSAITLEACEVVTPCAAALRSKEAAPVRAPISGDACMAPPVAVAALTTQRSGEGWIELDITDAASRWVADPTANNGLLLRVGDSGAAAQGIRFHSSEALQREEAAGLGGREVAWRPAFLLVPRK